MSSPVTIHLAQHIFTTTSCLIADSILPSRVVQLYNTSNGTHFHSTSSRIYTTSLFSLHSCKGLIVTFNASRCTIVLRFLPTEAKITRTMLPNVTVIENLNPYADISSFFCFPFLLVVRNYNMMVEIQQADVHCPSTIAFF